MSTICVFSIRRMIDFTLGFITYKRFQFSIVWSHKNDGKI